MSQIGFRYATTSERGLLWDSVPMRLWQKAKRLGTWDPAAIELGRDVADWSRLSETEQHYILRTLALFQAGEEAVTLELLPLIETVAGEQRMNELLGPAMGVVSEFWDYFDPDDGPFGQTMQKYLDYASVQFDKRMKVLERDRGKALAEIEASTLDDLANEAAAEVN